MPPTILGSRSRKRSSRKAAPLHSSVWDADNGRMKVLFIAPYVPSLIRVRPFNFIRSLAGLGHRVTVVALGVDGAGPDGEAQEALAPFCEAVHVIPHSKRQAALQCARYLATPIPLWAAYCFSPALENRLRRLLANDTYDVAHVEHVRAAHFARVLQGRLPLIFDGVDCIADLQQQLMRAPGRSAAARAVSWDEHRKLRRYEPRMAALFDRVIITSRQDARGLGELAAAQRLSLPIEVVPNGVDLEYFRPQTYVPCREDNLVFSGKMSYAANRDAAVHFATAIFPRVRQARPAATLTVAGSGPTPDLLALAARPQSGIVVTGRVPDLRPHLAQAAVALCPLRIGVGIQNKVLEAMAMGKAVVATSLAARSLEPDAPGRSLVIADGLTDYAAQVLRLLGDPAEARRLGDNARQYVERHHDWNRIAQRLTAIYEEAAGSRSLAA